MIIVTGATGFLGTNLCLSLLKEGKEVIGVDNLSTSRVGNLDLLEEYENFRFVKDDVEEVCYGSWDDLYKITQIYHLASPASPKTYTKLWESTIAANTLGTKEMLEIGVDGAQATILFASTSEVYGQPLEVPQKESYYGNRNSFGPRSLYDCSKALGETLCYQYKKEHGVSIRVPRIHNTFGPYMDINDGRVIINFIKQALTNSPITVYGDGTQYRCYTYVDDMVEGLKALMASDIQEPINLGSSFENKFSILETAHIIRNMIESDSPIVHQPIEADDPRERLPDLSKAKNELGWQATTGFWQGLKKTTEFVIEELLNEYEE